MTLNLANDGCGGRGRPDKLGRFGGHVSPERFEI